MNVRTITMEERHSEFLAEKVADGDAAATAEAPGGECASESHLSLVHEIPGEGEKSLVGYRESDNAKN
jgi:hypothetical protein